MANMLKTGSDWLESMRNTHLTSDVTYKRLLTELTVSATFGRTAYEIVDEVGFTIGSHVYDFLILASDLTAMEPEVGDMIIADGRKYEVMALGEDYQGWRWSDSYRTTYRIHTREAGATT